MQIQPVEILELAEVLESGGSNVGAVCQIKLAKTGQAADVLQSRIRKPAAPNLQLLKCTEPEQKRKIVVLGHIVGEHQRLQVVQALRCFIQTPGFCLSPHASIL